MLANAAFPGEGPSQPSPLQRSPASNCSDLKMQAKFGSIDAVWILREPNSNFPCQDLFGKTIIPLTTKMSSRGQVVIPQPIRARLRLEPCAEFVVVAKDDVLVLQRVPPPSWEQFDMLVREARCQARSAGFTLRHVKRAIAKVRGER